LITAAFDDAPEFKVELVFSDGSTEDFTDCSTIGLLDGLGATDLAMDRTSEDTRGRTDDIEFNGARAIEEDRLELVGIGA
jgi:hypothetical protein